jgi:hypothetical protein
MQDNGYGYELYYVNEKFSLLGGTNRAKTQEEIASELLDMNELKEKIKSIITHNGMPSNILLIHMSRYNLKNMSKDVGTEIHKYCHDLGQRPTVKDASFGQYKVYNIETDTFYSPDADTSLNVNIESTVTPRDPLSSLKSLMSFMDSM